MSENITIKAKRISSIDSIRLIAIFFVICIHTMPLLHISYYSSMIIDNIGRFAVPFFFIISGYFFSQKDDDFDYTLTKIFHYLRIYIIWAVIYLPFQLKFLGAYRNGSYSLWLKNLALSNNYMIHLWYIYALAVAMLLTFLLKRFNYKKIIILALMLYIVGVMGNAYYPFFAEYGLKYTWMVFGTTRNGIFFGFPLYYFGYLIGKGIIDTKINTFKIIILLLILSIVQFVEGFVIVVKIMGQIRKDYFFSTLPIAILLFFLLLRYKIFLQNSFLSRFADLTFGIYLIHFIYVLIGNVIKIKYKEYYILSDIIFAPLVFIFSFISVFLIKKIKFINRYI